MKIILMLLILALQGFFPPGAFSQGKMVFLNGREVRFKSAEVRGEYINFEREEDGPLKIRKADKYNVFSLQHDSGVEEVIYKPDTISGEDPSVEEAREYIKGEQYAMEHYKKPLNTVGGVLSGAAGSLIGFYGLPVPLVYATISGRFTPKLPEAERTKNFSESYIAGYERKSRNIKIKNNLIGGGIGFAVGITALAIIFND